MVSRWVVAMVAVGGYKDVQCKEVGVVVESRTSEYTFPQILDLLGTL